ncbi:hypothetical protein EON63_02820 [archaeon]|nr:MAG: hypothetical protein EON63_02820 [archaeon]
MEQVCGTRGYWAPEVISTDHTHYGCASDFFSLGCVLYEMLVGVNPFMTTQVERERERVCVCVCVCVRVCVYFSVAMFMCMCILCMCVCHGQHTKHTGHRFILHTGC